MGNDLGTAYTLYDKKEWSTIDQKLRGVAVKCFMDNYRIANPDKAAEAEAFKKYYEKDFPDDYKERLSDAEVDTVLSCIYSLQNNSSNKSGKFLLIGLAAVLVLALVFFLLFVKF